MRIIGGRLTIVKERILVILSDAAGTEVDTLSEETRLVSDLGLTSFDLSDIVVEVEEEFNIQIPDSLFPQIQTVGDVLRVATEVAENGAS